jgi:hypothetical protein
MVKQLKFIITSADIALGMKTPEFAHVNQIHKYKSYKKNKNPLCRNVGFGKILKIFF